jgi:hypothetical protein
MGLFPENTCRTRHNGSILRRETQRRRTVRSLAALLDVETPWMWAHNHYELQRPKDIKLFIDDKYTYIYIVQICHHFTHHSHVQLCYTDDRFTQATASKDINHSSDKRGQQFFLSPFVEIGLASPRRSNDYYNRLPTKHTHYLTLPAASQRHQVIHR